MAVADWVGTGLDGRKALAETKQFLALAFRRAEQRASAGAFIDGLLSRAERKTGWMLAEEAGLDRPYRLQSLIGRSSWSADELCDRVRHYVIDALGSADGVLVADETGFVKKGSIQLAWHGSIPARRDVWRTARSVSLPIMPAASAMP